MNSALAVVVRIRCIQSVDVREQHQAIGARHLRDARRQPVVVAVADLGGRHRVVLVDDGHRAQGEQRVQRAAGIQVAAALLGIAQGQQDLRHGDLVRLEQFLIGVREPDLPDRGSRLALLEFQLARSSARGAAARARWRRRTPESPPVRACAWRATSAAKLLQPCAVRAVPSRASTSSAEPTLTTTRLASIKRRAAVFPVSDSSWATQYCHLLERSGLP